MPVNDENHVMSVLPAVSAVIANRNGVEHLRVCLPSLRAQSYANVEIVVVDNASSDDSQRVAEAYGAKWLPLQKNVGLAPALNKGASAATGECLLFVNNDMRFDERFVESLVQLLLEDASIFAVDGMQYNWDGTEKGHLATWISTRRAEGLCLELVPGLFLQQSESLYPVPVLMASAASMMVRRSLFEKLGGFDERLPLSYEDVDICWRAWIHGWKTVYVPEAICWHRVGSSCRSPEASRLLFVGILKGRLAFATKLLPARHAALTWAASSAGLAKDMARMRWGFAWSRIKVLAEFALKISEFLQAKNELYRTRGTDAATHLDEMLQLGYARIVEKPWSSSTEKVAS